MKVSWRTRLHTPLVEPYVHQVLSLGHHHPENGKNNKDGKDLLGFENLSGEIKPRSQSDLPHHHFGCNDQNDGDTKTKAHTRKN